MLYEGADIQTGQRAVSQTVPAPTGGLNGRDPKASMDPSDAYVMDNVLPGTASCKVRNGVEIHSDVGSPVRSLEVYTGDTLTDHLLAFDASGKMWNVTTDTPVELRNDLASAETVVTMFETVADHAQFLIITTGNDQPMYYNGTNAINLVFTGPSGVTTWDYSNIHTVCSYQGRLFFGTKTALGFAYLPPGQIQGDLEWFDLGQIAKDGGTLAAIATYSDDAGDGPSDYIVFITTKGEYIMYRGIDPGDANNWDMVGRFKSAPPIGRKCVIDFAGDIITLTLEGALQFSQIRKFGATNFRATALTDKLGDILLNHNKNRQTYGWCMQLYSRGGWLIVSVPDTPNETGMYHHFYMNTTTQAWGKVYGDEMKALCWCVANNNLYFGRYDGSVRQADVGANDNGNPIQWAVRQAYNYFKSMDYKHYKWAIFLAQSESKIAISSNLSVDFKENKPIALSGVIDPTAGAEWDISYWDAGDWASGPYQQKIIQPYGQYGVTSSWWLEGQLKGSTFEWFATQLVYEKAEGLLG